MVVSWFSGVFHINMLHFQYFMINALCSKPIYFCKRVVLQLVSELLSDLIFGSAFDSGIVFCACYMVTRSVSVFEMGNLYNISVGD